MPDGELALCGKDAHECRADVGTTVAVDQGEERHLCAVSVPEREGRVLLCLGIVVTDLRRGDHRVIHRRIEDGTVVGIRCLDLDPPECLVPLLVGLSLDSFEIPVHQLLPEVRLSLIDRGSGDAHTCHDRGVTVTVSHAEVSHRVAFLTGEGHGTVELSVEIDALVLRPAMGVTVTRDDRRRELHVTTVVHLVPADTLIEVEPQQWRLARRERVTVQSGMRGGGELCLDAVACDDGVITRHTVLRAAVYRRLCLVVTHDGQQSDVTEVTDARATEVGVAEADDDVVTDVVTRAPVPAARDHRRTELHETKRHVGA